MESSGSGARMIAICTDFGHEGPYLGQMEAVLYREAPGVPLLRLFVDLPRFDARASAYLLAAYAAEFPAGTVFLCVVDPGVGSARRPLAMHADGRWFVGPENGLFEIVRRRADRAEVREVCWRPGRLSASFHGRDLFAPVAARLANGDVPHSRPVAADGHYADWPDDLAEIIYVDHYGNAMTGMRARRLSAGAVVEVAGHRLFHARTFSEVPPGACFWYENANGLVEIAANRASAAARLGLSVGSCISVSQARPA